MDFVIAVGWKKHFEPSAWSVGYCKRCKRYEAVQIGREVTDVSVYRLIPVGRSAVDGLSRCDWCGKPVRPRRGGESVPTARWSYADGVRALFKACAPDIEDEAPRFETDDELRALLGNVQRRSSLTSVEIGFGLSTGLWVGAALAAPLGLLLELEGRNTEFRGMVLAAVAGGLLGAVVGAFLDGRGQTRDVALALVQKACLKYQIDPAALSRASAAFPHRIRDAVRVALAGPLTDRPVPQSPEQPRTG